MYLIKIYVSSHTNIESNDNASLPGNPRGGYALFRANNLNVGTIVTDNYYDVTNQIKNKIIIW